MQIAVLLQIENLDARTKQVLQYFKGDAECMQKTASYKKKKLIEN